MLRPKAVCKGISADMGHGGFYLDGFNAFAHTVPWDALNIVIVVHGAVAADSQFAVIQGPGDPVATGPAVAVPAGRVGRRSVTCAKTVVFRLQLAAAGEVDHPVIGAVLYAVPNTHKVKIFVHQNFSMGRRVHKRLQSGSGSAVAPAPDLTRIGHVHR